MSSGLATSSTDARWARLDEAQKLQVLVLAERAGLVPELTDSNPAVERWLANVIVERHQRIAEGEAEIVSIDDVEARHDARRRALA